MKKHKKKIAIATFLGIASGIFGVTASPEQLSAVAELLIIVLTFTQ